MKSVVVGLGNDPLAVQSKSIVLTQGGGISNLQELRGQRSQLKVNFADGGDNLWGEQPAPQGDTNPDKRAG